MYACIGLDVHVYIGGIYTTELLVIGELTNLILVIGELSEVYIHPPPPLDIHIYCINDIIKKKQ